MLKITAFAIGILTIVAIAPKSEAMSPSSPPVSIETATANLHSQVILNNPDRDRRYNRDRGYSRGSILQQRRDLERRREADRRRYRYDERRDRSYPVDGYRRDR
ncbi:hypothetical protein [Chamaesiphon sp. VAR_69_metabat_338]|uniref:hypothetical protein n=1 Tax=Chamaesiphon sp. VAR_69_metabat_338 TaxID=2964704 RepID=UPI00286DFC7B|nr:hypothetical protein [Chamaesiphon sp. VAR_69_metabat_338]